MATGPELDALLPLLALPPLEPHPASSAATAIAAEADTLNVSEVPSVLLCPLPGGLRSAPSRSASETGPWSCAWKIDPMYLACQRRLGRKRQTVTETISGAWCDLWEPVPAPGSSGAGS